VREAGLHADGEDGELRQTLRGELRAGRRSQQKTEGERKPIASRLHAAAPGDSLGKINIQNDPNMNRAVVGSNNAGHLVVISNSAFVSAQNGSPQNIMMVQNLIDWLSQDANLIAVRTRSVKDRTIDADLLKKGSSKPGIIRFINIIAMPLLVILIGIIIFIRRREKIAVAPAASSSSTASAEKGEEKTV